ncbi:MAG TPA: hypothetical protein VKB03_09805 [Conexibacter sp.]|nr:hypothetical protein [Conexibacter sp.]
MRSCKFWIIGSAAGALLGLVAGAANAARLELPAGERFRVTWGPIEFAPPIGATVRCNMTIEGSFHTRTIVKTLGSLIGQISRATMSGCAGTVLAETLPWHVTYGGFAGTLPNITSITTSVVGAAMSLANEWGTCLFRTSSARPMRLIGDTAAWEEELELESTGFIVPTLRVDESARIPLTGGFCSGSEGSARGRGSVTVLAGTRKIRVGLVGVAQSGEMRQAPVAADPNLIEFIIHNDALAGGPRLRVGLIFLEGVNPRNYAIEDPRFCESRNLAPGHYCTYYVRRIVAGGAAVVVARVNFGTGRVEEPVI